MCPTSSDLCPTSSELCPTSSEILCNILYKTRFQAVKKHQISSIGKWETNRSGDTIVMDIGTYSTKEEGKCHDKYYFYNTSVYLQK